MIKRPSPGRPAPVTRLAALALVVLTAVIVPQAMGTATRADATALPVHGVLHPGKSLAGVKLGDSMARVKQIWGPNYKVCQGKQCPNPTWYYIYPKGEPLGASVRFKNGRVVTIFTLGSPMGWRTAEGLIIGEQVDRISQLYGKLTWNVCIGYGAMTMRTDAAVTSIYT